MFGFQCDLIFIFDFRFFSFCLLRFVSACCVALLPHSLLWRPVHRHLFFGSFACLLRWELGRHGVPTWQRTDLCRNLVLDGVENGVFRLTRKQTHSYNLRIVTFSAVTVAAGKQGYLKSCYYQHRSYWVTSERRSQTQNEHGCLKRRPTTRNLRECFKIYFGMTTKLNTKRHTSRYRTIYMQGTVKGGRRQGRQRKRWEDNNREWTGLEFAKSQRAVENREKWMKQVVKSSVVPQRPPRLMDRWRWRIHMWYNWGQENFSFLSTGFRYPAHFEHHFQTLHKKNGPKPDVLKRWFSNAYQSYKRGTCKIGG